MFGCVFFCNGSVALLGNFRTEIFTHKGKNVSSRRVPIAKIIDDVKHCQREPNWLTKQRLLFSVVGKFEYEKKFDVTVSKQRSSQHTFTIYQFI